MLMRAYQKVVILCPAVITGGPEAMHQLCDAINKAGGNAVLVYYDGASMLDLSDNMIASQPTLSAAFLGAYSNYDAPHEEVVNLSSDMLVVFPETLALPAFSFRGCKRAVWWLSVDNGLGLEPLFSYKQFCNGYFNDQTLIHFYQSDYARNFLMEHGARTIHPLFDYINRGFLQRGPLPLKQPLVSFFPAKGRVLANSFFEQAHDLPSVAIENMSPQQVSDMLRQTSVYIDFGHHPGKDRVPREAAVSGNIVFIHSKGAGCHFLDYPLDQFFIFTMVDLKTGELAQKVRACLGNHAHYHNQQWLYRRRIENELEEFTLQVKTSFFSGSLVAA